MQNTEFSKLLSSNYSKYLNYAFKLVHSKENAKDLFQDASLKAFKSLNQLNDLSNFTPWFYRIIYTTFISQYNRKKRRIDLVSTHGNHPSLFFNRSTVNNKGYEELKHSDIINFIETLKPKYKEPLLLYSQGFSYKEISDSYDIALGTVKSRINMARKKMKNISYLTSAA